MPTANADNDGWKYPIPPGPLQGWADGLAVRLGFRGSNDLRYRRFHKHLLKIANASIDIHEPLPPFRILEQQLAWHRVLKQTGKKFPCLLDYEKQWPVYRYIWNWQKEESRRGNRPQDKDNVPKRENVEYSFVGSSRKRRRATLGLTPWGSRRYEADDDKSEPENVRSNVKARETAALQRRDEEEEEDESEPEDVSPNAKIRKAASRGRMTLPSAAEIPPLPPTPVSMAPPSRATSTPSYLPRPQERPYSYTPESATRHRPTTTAGLMGREKPSLKQFLGALIVPLENLEDGFIRAGIEKCCYVVAMASIDELDLEAVIKEVIAPDITKFNMEILLHGVRQLPRPRDDRSFLPNGPDGKDAVMAFLQSLRPRLPFLLEGLIQIGVNSRAKLRALALCNEKRVHAMLAEDVNPDVTRIQIEVFMRGLRKLRYTT